MNPLWHIPSFASVYAGVVRWLQNRRILDALASIRETLSQHGERLARIESLVQPAPVASTGSLYHSFTASGIHGTAEAAPIKDLSGATITAYGNTSGPAIANTTSDSFLFNTNTGKARQLTYLEATSIPSPIVIAGRHFRDGEELAAWLKDYEEDPAEVARKIAAQTETGRWRPS